jgi:hypothetical protein
VTGPPPPPDGPSMRDEMSDCWARLVALEEIAERLTATCADPIAVSDFWLWKASR